MKNQCICGSDQFREFERDFYEVTVEGKTQQAAGKKFALAECLECGIIRQINMPFSADEEYIEFYQKKYPPNGEKYKAKDYRHDRELAEIRCSVYGIGTGYEKKILDVGAGSGAFVDECRSHGAIAYGCEIAEYNCQAKDDFIYHKRLEDIYFPTDSFDIVTCHDVLEHTLDPDKFINEMFRIVKQRGICIIDFPDFFVEVGKHHWKEEHFWYFTANQLEKILKDKGFIIKKVVKPIESKIVFYCTKPHQKRTSILLPPGIGDSYWSIVKLQSFLEKKKIDLPDIYVACNREKKYQGHKRSFPFIEMFPFVHSTGEALSTRSEEKIWREAYAQEGRTIFENVLGCDYFISYNGHLRVGKQLEQIDPELECNWNPSMFVSLEQENFKRECVEKYGKYIVFYFVFQGTYQYWTKQFSIDKVISFVQRLSKETNCKPIFVGANWDRGQATLKKVKSSVPGSIDMVGKTSISQVFGLIKGSELLVGYPSGLSIMAAALKKKTLIIWNDYYDRDFAWYACPPGTRNKTYFIENTEGINVNNLVKMGVNIIENDVVKSRLPLPSPKTKKREKRVIAKQQNPSRNINQTRRRIFVENRTIAVLCVLKSGGDYDLDYVVKLRNMVNRHSTIPYEFVCLTDIDIDESICKSIKLVREHGGWWSKIELFREGLTKANRIVYFDLDTIILKNIDDILRFDHSMSALQPWNERNRRKGLCASGMMAWRNDGLFSFLFEQFDPKKIKNYRGGDQEYISEILANNGEKIDFFQKFFSGIYSYKRNCKESIPEDARIICFHGKPRPHEMKDKWVRENWK